MYPAESTAVLTELPPSFESQLHEPRIRLRQLIGKAAILAGLGIAGAVYGLFEKPVEINVGPHQAKVDLSLDSENTIDAGPVGSIHLPAYLPGPLGSYIELGEIPVSANISSNYKENSDELVTQYQYLLSDPESDVDSAKDALLFHALKWGAYGMAGGTALGWTGARLLGKSRREELKAMAVEGLQSKKTKAFAAASCLGASLLFPITSPNVTSAAVPVDSIFEGTPIENARVSGEIMRFLTNEVGARFYEEKVENDLFYDDVSENLIQTFKRELPPPASDTTRILATSDIHCNFGMIKVVATAVKESQTELLFDVGDLTFRGTEYEENLCVRPTGKIDTQKVIALGNHDDAEITGKQVKKHGFTVLDGSVITKASLSILGDSDPMRSDFGPIYQIGEENVEAAGLRLGRTACDADTPVDFLLTHSPTSAINAMASKCIKVAITGHTHHYKVTNNEDSMIINVGTTGGAKKHTITVGPLQVPATFVILDVDKTSGDVQSFRPVTVTTDATVEVGTVTEFARSTTVAGNRGYY